MVKTVDVIEASDVVERRAGKGTVLIDRGGKLQDAHDVDVEFWEGVAEAGSVEIVLVEFEGIYIILGLDQFEL